MWGRKGLRRDFDHAVRQFEAMKRIADDLLAQRDEYRSQADSLRRRCLRLEAENAALRAAVPDAAVIEFDIPLGGER